MKKIAVIGTRTFEDYELLATTLRPYGAVLIVTGGARGADALAMEYAAKELNARAHVFLPDWNRLGKSAGMIRNQQIIDEADELVAFWEGKSRGTEDSIRKAHLKGIPVKVVRF